MSSKTYADTVGRVGKNVKWNLNKPKEMSMEEYLSMDKNYASSRKGLYQVCPSLADGKSSLFYDSTIGNLYSAVKRQCIEVTQPEPDMLKTFFRWFDLLFTKEVEPLLESFEYDFGDWYNHLTAAQQNELDSSIIKMKNAPEQLKKRSYSMFCKREKQMIDDDTKNPKNRCICAPNPEYKLVMGPVVYGLDHLFRKFKGYCQGKNWEQMEEKLNLLEKQGLDKVVEGDGSGFDRTQTHDLKGVERKIYHWLANHGKIHHVPESVFLYHVDIVWRKIRVTHSEVIKRKMNFKQLGHVSIKGTVFSGDCDTTFGNTLRMALYNRFVAEQYMNLNTEQYEVVAKGDDFALFVSPNVSNEVIKDAYYTVFSKSKTGIHGLGQILKFLKIGSIETMDFCSTETFKCQGCKSYKIVRQLPRFVQLMPWSHSVLSLSNDEKDQYLHSLYEANLSWMNGLPVFTELNKHFKRNYWFAAKPKKGCERRKWVSSAGIVPIKTRLDIMSSYSREDYYSMLDRVSEKKACCAKSFTKHLERYYNLSSGELASVCKIIANTARDSGFYHAPQLVEAFKFKANSLNSECLYNIK